MGTKIIETGSTAGGIAKVEYKDEAGNVLWYYDDAGNFVRNGNVKASSFSISTLNTAPASATATGTAGEIRVTSGGIYYCIATNVWRKALNVISVSETLTGLTTSYTASSLGGVQVQSKYMWVISSGSHLATIESLHNFYSGINFLSLVIGATVATVTANSVFSFRLGDSVIYIKFDTGTGVVSFSVASGTITSITVNKMAISASW